MKKQISFLTFTLFSVFFILSSNSTAQLLQSGNLDLSFGNAGKIRDGFGSGYDFGNDLLIQTDGKIVVVGNSLDGNVFGVSVARYNADGMPDDSFGKGGKTLDTQLDATAFAAAIQTDGKIVVAGKTRIGSSDFFAVRFNSDGSLDKSFGYGGKTIIQVSAMGDEARDIAVLPDGKIVLAGFSFDPTDTYFAIVRLNSDGSLDSTYGNNSGKIISNVTSNRDYLTSFAVQTDGKIVASGYSTISGNSTPVGFLVVRYNQDGNLDQTFGTGGVISILGNSAKANSVALQTDGKIVVVGSRQTNESIIARFQTDGTPDANFGNGGIASMIIGENGDTLKNAAIQANGKIVAVNNYTAVRLNSDGTPDENFGDAGILSQSNSSSRIYYAAVGTQTDGKIVLAGAFQNDLAAVRLINSGRRDLRFGRNGLALIDAGNMQAAIKDIVVQPDGKIIAVGYAKLPKKHIVAARYNSDGSPDTSFGAGGKVFTTINSEDCEAHKVILQPDGKIIAAGYTLNAQIVSYPNHDFVMVRYNSDGTIDETFGNNGKAVNDFDGSLEEIASVVVQPDGKILALRGSSAGYAFYNLIARYNPDGSLDTSFGKDGTVKTFFNETYVRIVGMILQDNGKIVAIGNDQYNLILTRYTSDGATDSGFGASGKVFIPNSNDYFEYGYDAILQPNGKIVVAGIKYLTFTQSAFQLTRINADGSLDKSFGENGKAITPIVSGIAWARSLANQSDGKLVVAGFIQSGENYDAAVTRYNNDGSPDRLFCSTNCSRFYRNFAILNLSIGDDVPHVVKIDNQGRIIVAGEASEVFSVIRLTGTPFYAEKSGKR